MGDVLANSQKGRRHEYQMKKVFRVEQAQPQRLHLDKSSSSTKKEKQL